MTTPSGPQQPYSGAHPPRQPHIPQPFRRGGWVLAALVTAAVLTWWYALASDAALAIFAALIFWVIFFFDVRGFSSLAGRHPWDTAGNGYKAWMTLAFVFVPEVVVPVCLWFAVKDHLAANQTTLRGQAAAQWRRFQGASRGAQIGIATGALVAVVALCSLNNAAAAAGQAFIGAATTTSVTGSNQSTQNNGSSSSSSSTGGQVAPITDPTATPTLAPTATATALPPTATPRPPAPTATPRPPAPPPTQPPSQSCYPLTNGGNCYEPGEYCRYSDRGTTGIAGDGERIKCIDNNGWRWEPY